MKVSEAMTRDVRVASPNETIRDAARMMAEIEAGALPVGENDHEVLYCYDDQDVDEVAKNMGDVQVRRLPVVNRDKRLVGIISLGDVVCNQDMRDAGDTVAQVSQPGGQHAH
jgi:CBS domain-containing protein